MKRIVGMIMGSMMTFGLVAQTIELGTQQTTTLIFPFPVVHVDRGTAAILAQPVDNVNNVLLVKAAARNFEKTNLTVITSEGSVYALTVVFADQPAQYTYQMPTRLHNAVELYARGILASPPRMHGMRDESWDIVGRVVGIYMKDGIVYYQLRISNGSPVDYEVEFLRFYIRDKRQGKRTAVQELAMRPVATVGNVKMVEAYHENSVVVAMEKFTIPDKKYFVVELNEHNGGRHLRIKVGNRQIMRAKFLPDIQ